MNDANEMNFTDRNGTPLEVGQTINLQQAVGSHGQTRIVSGEVSELYDNPPGVTIRLDQDLNVQRSNGHTTFSACLKAGGLLYAELPKNGLEAVERLYDGVRYETWVEVTAEKPEAEEEPAVASSRLWAGL